MKTEHTVRFVSRMTGGYRHSANLVTDSITAVGIRLAILSALAIIVQYID